jgi:hypothetical protein
LTEKINLISEKPPGKIIIIFLKRLDNILKINIIPIKIIGIIG